jgi:CBS domain-containing protein
MTATLSGATSLEHLLGTVGEAMTPQVTALAVDTPADVALRRLERAKVSGAPVVDPAGRPVGILTRDDVLRALADRIRLPGRGSQLEPD